MSTAEQLGAGGAEFERAIKTLHVFTVGGVVRLGDPVVEIVPKGDRLIVEAKLQTGDIGYVAEGQPAVVKLASADAMRFGGLDGTVMEYVLTPLRYAMSGAIQER